MAWLKCRFRSNVLDIDTSLQAIIPEHQRGPWPTLYLLHGLADDDAAWCRYSSIERYANERGLAVIMPSCGRSFYCNMVYGPRWFDFLTSELPSVAGRLFPLSDKREGNFVAGLSMGGYGAFKWALREPHRFAAAASLSGSLDIAAMTERADPPPDAQLIFGGQSPKGSDDDLLTLVKQFSAAPDTVPKLYQWCGTEDFLYQPNQDFLSAARAAGVGVDYSEGPGDHQWRYWDAQIARVIDWLPL
ncbi:hypothetical protein R84981_002366 [Carnimonas sp. R-84981]|uniref:alpha/beta hydrolase n=1 Tax=Carnimonas bestiolae TaxID=3402172 RepID=UPI003EDC0C70